MMSLIFAEQNKEFIIKDIKGKDKERVGLTEKGFYVGNKVCLLKDDKKNFVVKVNNAKYILGFSLAKKIMIDIE